MKPADGTYRLSTPGAPSMDVVVTGNVLKTTLDTFDYVPAQGVFVARRLSCVIECTGTGAGMAFVGVTPGFPVPLTCVTPPPP